MYALNLDENNRILSATFDEFAPQDQPRVEELPQGNIADYKYIDNEFVYDTLPQPKPPEPQPTDVEKLRADVDFIAMMTDIDLEG